MKETPARPLPHIGLRNLKTALSASLCALIYFFLNRNPAFACIGAIFGMGADMDHSKLHGGKPPVRHRYRRFPRHRALPDLPGLLSRRGTPPVAGAPALRRYRRPDSAGPDLLGRRRTARRGWCSACCCSPSARTTTSLTLSTACWTPGVGVAMSLLINGLLPRERLDAWQEKLGALRNRSEAGR